MPVLVERATAKSKPVINNEQNKHNKKDTNKDNRFQKKNKKSLVLFLVFQYFF